MASSTDVVMEDASGGEDRKAVKKADVADTDVEMKVKDQDEEEEEEKLEIGAKGGEAGSTAVKMDVDAVAGDEVQAENTGGDTAAGADDDDDDPVVQECDVVLNRLHDPPDFVGDMYVLQYPLRPLYRRYGDQGTLHRVELKPKARKLRFLYKLNSNDNFDDDESVGEKSKHVLEPVVIANPAYSFAVGVICEGRMTLTSVHAVNQLRPDPSTDAKKKVAGEVAPMEDNASGNDSGDDNDATAEAMPSAVKVEITMGPKGGTEEAAGTEEWQIVDWFDMEKAEALDIFEKHLVWPAKEMAEADRSGIEPDHPKLQPLSFQGDVSRYLAAFCGHAPPRAVEAKKDVGVPVKLLSRFPVERQIESIVRHYCIVSFFKHIRAKLPPATLLKHKDTELIEWLRQCAVPVHGNWVLKSTLVGYSGREEVARDLLLCMLASGKGAPINQKALEAWAEQTGITVQQRDEIARGFLERCPDDSLKLKLSHDKQFLQKFPDLCKELRQWWDTERQNIMKKAQMLKKMPQAQGSRSGVHYMNILSKVREVLAMGAITANDLQRALQEKNALQVIQLQDVKKALADPELGACEVRNLWMLAKTSNAENDKYRGTLIDLFRRRDAVTKFDIDARYEEMHSERCSLSEHIKRNLLREIASKVWSSELNSDTYVLKEMVS